MRWTPITFLPLAALAAPQYAAATAYLTTEQAQQALFPGGEFVPAPVLVSDALRQILKERSGVHEPFRGDRVWRVKDGGYFVIDEVLGKHELIKYAVAISADGAVRGVEIMEYSETYGYEVRDAAWRRQFVGKRVQAPLRLTGDIQNISGATLSCKHVTDGVKRVLVLHELILKAGT